MKRLLTYLMILAMAVIAFMGCEEEPTKQETPETATAVFVLNSAAKSISVIDLEKDTVYNNVATVGTWPNQLVYKDGYLYVVNSGSNNIMIFNTSNWTAQTPIDLGAGNNPTNMVFYDNDKIYVACSMSNKVLKVSLASKAVVGSINTDVGSTGIIKHNNKIYVCNTAFNGSTYTYGQGTVQVIDPATDQLVKRINVPTNPFDLKAVPDGKIHVVCVGNYYDIPGKIAIIDPTTNTMVDSIAIGGAPGNIAVSEDDNIAYLSVWGAGLMSYNTATKEVLHGPTNPILGKGGSGVLVDKDGNVFVSVWDDDQVIKLDKDGTVLKTYNVGDSPSALELKIE